MPWDLCVDPSTKQLGGRFIPSELIRLPNINIDGRHHGTAVLAVGEASYLLHLPWHALAAFRWRLCC